MVTAALSIPVDKADGYSDFSVISYSFSFEKPDVNNIQINNQVFSKVNMHGCFNVGQSSGSPSLPMKSIKLLLPPGKTISSINIGGIPVEIKFPHNDLKDNPIYPHQPSVPIGQSSPFIIDEEKYDSTTKLPINCYEYLGVDYCRGYSISTLNLCPVQYIPFAGRFFYYPEMTVELNLSEKYYNQFFRAKSIDSSYVASFVTNPEIVDLYSNEDSTIGSSFYDGGLCDPSDSYDYVIITREALVDFTATYNWTDFINRKQSEGLVTTIVSIEDITSCSDYYNSSPLFNDTAAQVREFVKDAYLDWGIQYVLVAGDQDGPNAIERRYMYNYAEYGNVETDLYWSNLDKTFNADGDYRWGEEGDNGFDLYAELFIGSIPCDTGTDISNWMTKCFYYADSTEIDYLDNVAFFGGNLDQPPWNMWPTEGDDFMDFTLYGTDMWIGPYPAPMPAYLGFLYGFDTWNSSHPDMKFNTSVRWTGEGSDYDDDGPNPGWQGGSTSIAVDGLKNAINNNRVTLLNAVAHADEDMSMDVQYYDWESNYHNTKPFFLHDYGCHCGDMDASNDGVLHSMLFHSDTELAFGCVFNTGYGYGDHDNTNASSALQQKLFWDYMLNLSKCNGVDNWQLGKAQAYSKNEMANTINWESTWRHIIQCCLLFGDPAQKIKPPGSFDTDVHMTTLSSNWNLVSLPFNESVPKTNVTVNYAGSNYSWANAVSNGYVNNFIFGWDRVGQSYTMPSMFNPGEGYWLYANVDCELWIDNITIEHDEDVTSLQPNWNLIGVPNMVNVDKTNLTVNYAGSDYSWSDAVSNGYISDFIFGWDRVGQSYTMPSTFNPGEGYWLYANLNCILKKPVTLK